jgi:Ca2+-binding EF-hand superfamily protein
MTEDERVEEFLGRFDAADTDKSGPLVFAEFDKLFPELVPNTAEKRAEYYFAGMDINGDQSVSREEFRAFVLAMVNKNQDYALK